MTPALGIVWYILIGVLIVGYALLDGFDLGVGILYPFIAKTEAERTTLRHSIGPVWDGNEVWLLTAGGALFAAFPAVYATVFSGFYLAMMLVLFCLIFRAVSLDYSEKEKGGKTGFRGWDLAFFLGSTVAALLLGVALGNVVRGIPIGLDGEFAGGFFDLLNPLALVIGLTGLAMIIVHGACWTVVKTAGALSSRAAAVRSWAHWVFVLLVAVATICAALIVPEQAKAVVGNPVGIVALVVLVLGIVLARFAMMRKKDGLALVGSAFGILGLVAIAAVGNYPAVVPALGTPERSLTIANSASSHLTLLVMLIIACIGVPIVLAYTALVYRSFWGKVKSAG
jgi:cytochrome d ubiquinol oxidase subunit II